MEELKHPIVFNVPADSANAISTNAVEIEATPNDLMEKRVEDLDLIQVANNVHASQRVFDEARLNVTTNHTEATQRTPNLNIDSENSSSENGAFDNIIPFVRDDNFDTHFPVQSSGQENKTPCENCCEDKEHPCQECKKKKRKRILKITIFSILILAIIGLLIYAFKNKE